MQQSLKSYCVNKISNTKSLILGRLSLRYPFPGVLPDGGWKRRKTTAVLPCIPDLGLDQTPTDAFNLGLLLFSPSVHGGKPWPPPRSAAFLELRGSARVTFGGRIFQMQISPLDREWNLLPLMKGTSGGRAQRRGWPVLNAKPSFWGQRNHCLPLQSASPHLGPSAPGQTLVS